MKKHISLSTRGLMALMALIMSLQVSAESCSLHFSDITINPGGTAQMVVSYETDYENLNGFETHFILPDGISLANASAANSLLQVRPNLTVEFAPRRYDGKTVVLCYNAKGELFPSGKHDLLVLTFQADQNIAKQTYDIEIQDNIFSCFTDSAPNYMPNQIFHITVENKPTVVNRGDVNGDGLATLLDVLILVDYIIAGKPLVIDAQLYDIDGDGDVSINDVFIVVDTILKGDDEPQAYLTCPDDHHPHLIDLGLPSGTLWSCCNVGATIPEGYGGYYAWGETEEKDYYSWDTFLYSDGSYETCQYLGDISGTIYDVAHVKWGGAWRMPTEDEIEEIRSKCSVETFTINNVVCDRYTGPNGNEIIFPYAGLMWFGSNTDIGKEISYWGSTQTQKAPYQAPYLRQGGGMGFRWLFEGLPVRPVYDPSFFFSLSDETVDVFVNSTTTVAIEMGSGEYELQNDNPDIADADLIIVDKEGAPDAKDEISIYGVAEGTDTLTVLDKQKNKTATVVVNVKTPTEEDIAETEDYIARVRDFINQQGEISVADFQSNLASWLGEQDWVKAFNSGSVTSLPVLMTISFVNGANYLVSLIDYDDLIGLGIDEDFHSSEYYASKELPTNSSIDVSTVVGEDIIDNTNVLHIQGRTMPSFDKQNQSTAERENYLIQQSKNKSPIKFEITPQFKDPSFLEWNSLNNYGMILLGQTHGGFLLNSTYSGSFEVENGLNSLNRGVKVIVDKDKVVKIDEEHNIYYVTPIKLKNKIDDKTIFYSSYCYSYYLRQCNFNATFFGYGTREMYQKGSYQMAEFFYNMSMGLTYEKAIESMMKPYDYKYDDEKEYSHVIPSTNKPKSKQRYFSISTDDVTEYSQNGPVVTGAINGYKNLKSDIRYYVYAFPKGEELKPEDITKGQIIDKSKLTILDDGNSATFSHEYTGLFSEFPEEYQVVVGFMFGGVYYYGPIKTITTKGLCPDDNHPHIIDLGLPSGTKWACCNVGASSPDGYGGYYAWGETEEKSIYDFDHYQHRYQDDYGNWLYKDIGADIAGTKYDVAHVRWGGSWVMPSRGQLDELKNNCTSQWTTLNGVKGRVFKSPNGGSIFLPAAGHRWSDDLNGAGSYGCYWSSTQLPSDSYYAYRLDFGSGFVDWFGNRRRYYGHSVRPVSR